MITYELFKQLKRFLEIGKCDKCHKFSLRLTEMDYYSKGKIQQIVWLCNNCQNKLECVGMNKFIERMSLTK